MKYLMENKDNKNGGSANKPHGTRFRNYWCLSMFNFLDSMIFC